MPKTFLTALLSTLVLSVAAPSVGTPAQGERTPTRLGQKPTVAKGETLSEMSNSIWVVFQAKNGSYWFGSDGQGVFRYDGKTITRFTTKDGLPSDRIREIKEDKAANIYIGTLEGISKFDGASFTILKPVRHDTPADGWSLHPDDLWFKGNSEVNGPYRYDGRTLHHLIFPKHHLEDEYHRDNPNGVATPYGVYTIYRDRRGDVWFGTSALGLCRYDGKTLSWMYEKELTYPPSGGSFGIRSIIEDKEGKFWICNTRQRYAISSDSTTERGAVLIKYQRERGINNLKAPNGDDFIYYQTIAKDDRQDLWMSTYRDGAWRYDGETMTHYPVKDGDKQVLLVSVYKDNRGDLWLGTQESGAYKFNGKTFEKFRP
jgi:ligand-binding sensor domain-containing protein